MSARPRARWWRIVDWRVVAAAGVSVWAAVIGFVVWDKARAKARVAELPAVQVLPARSVPLPAPPEPAAAEAAPKEIAPPVVVVPVVLPQPAPPAPRRGVPFWLRDEADAEPEEQAEAPADGCQTHGTAVRFVKSPTEAMQKAREEDKLVLVLHLSGNLEDEGFT